MELPNWVYDLVMAIEDWEDDGHSLSYKLTDELQLPAEFDTIVTKKMCHAKWLNMVPKDVRGKADAIREYKRVLEMGRQNEQQS